MKYFSFLFVLLGCSLFSFAQSEVLPKDEKGKFIYYEVVDKQTSLDSLQLLTKNFFNPKDKNMVLRSTVGDTTFIAAGKFLVARTKAIPSHPSGEVLYDLRIELKSGKYRFWLTEFKFIPYQRDRYSNFVPSTTVGQPLENDAGILNAGQWKEIQQQAANNSKVFASRLKASLANSPIQKKKQETKTIKKEW